jgi:hypothetical protein
MLILGFVSAMRFSRAHVDQMIGFCACTEERHKVATISPADAILFPWRGGHENREDSAKNRQA